MAQRVRLAKALASSSNGASIRLRSSRAPYVFVATGGFAGNVTIQYTVDDPSVADTDATWIDLDTIANGDQIDSTTPLYRIRVEGTHSSGTATVDMLEEVS